MAKINAELTIEKIREQSRNRQRKFYNKHKTQEQKRKLEYYYKQKTNQV